jgi:hypothetical protein
MPLLRRRRPLLRAAAVGGGAYVAGKRRAGREEQEAGYAPEPAEQPGAGGLSSDAVQRLQQLGALHDQGVLTDEEFAQQKAKLLAG